MDKRLLLGAFPVMLSVMLLSTAGTVVAQPTIDGILSPGEWDAYYLGTSVTTWGGGMAVDVYGYADATYLYVAYEADTSQPGWPTADLLNVNANFYFKTPQTIAWPDEGYTILEMVFPRLMQTDGSDWDYAGALDLDDVPGLEYAYTDMFAVPYGLYDPVAEFKIPLSVLTYAGTDWVIAISGTYWQYDWATTFYVVPPISALEDLKDEVSELSDDDLKNPAANRKVTLMDKVDDAIAKVNAEDYKGAIRKLLNDIRPKLDFGDRRTWLEEGHSELLDKIDDVVEMLEDLL